MQTKTHPLLSGAFVFAKLSGGEVCLCLRDRENQPC